MKSKPNDEQQAAIDYNSGPMILLAGAGSGKTFTLTAKVQALIAEGIAPERILGITFTNKAANELKERLEIEEGGVHPRVGTIHSLALWLIRKDPTKFGLGPKVTPIDDYDQKTIVETILEKLKDEELKAWNFLEKTKFHRARGIGFSPDYTPEVHAQALQAYGGYMALTEKELNVWALYEKTKACHPAGTLVEVVVSPASVGRWKGFQPAVTELRPIETLKDGDRVVPWRRKDGRCLYAGAKVQVGSRNYSGIMLRVTQDSGESVDMTPDHQVWVKFNKSANGKFIVYVMANGDKYRIGTTGLAYDGASSRRMGLTGRFATEEADKAWVVKVCDTKEEAYMWEQIWSYQFGIPQTTFRGQNQHQIDRIFEEVDSKKGAVALLHSLGLLEGQPLITREGRTWGWFRFFKTAACNIIPGLMSLPVRTRPTFNKGAQNTWRIPEGCVVTDVSSYRYSDKVYSLEVEDHHTYIANGVVVGNCQGVVDFDDMLHLVVKRGNEDPAWLRRIQGYYDYILVDEAQDTNVVQWALINNFFGPTNFNLCAVGDLSQSIYGFAGASPDILYGYTQSWRGQTPKLFKLERNHRSVPEVVGLANRIQKTMTETVPLRMESFRGNQGERGFTGMITSPTQLQLAEEIAASIDRDRKRMHLRNFAILVRSGSQVKDIEPALVKRKIPYLIRGASGFLQSQEVKDVLAYLRVAVNPRDYAAFERSATTPKRGVGPAALEKIRDKSDEHEGDLIGTCEDKGTLLLYTTLIRKVQEMKEDPVACLDYIIKHTGYMKYLEEKVCKVKGRVDKDKLEMKTNNLNRLKETFQALLDTSNLTLDDIVFQLAMNGDKDVEDEEGKVIISTIHASKGLEWPVVYVFGVVEGQLPHKYSQSAKEIEEERRVAYVACTRSRDRLLLCVPGCIKTPYSETMVSPSRFLYEWGVLKR